MQCIDRIYAPFKNALATAGIDVIQTLSLPLTFFLSITELGSL